MPAPTLASPLDRCPRGSWGLGRLALMLACASAVGHAQLYIATDLGSVPYVAPAAPTIPLTLYDESQASIPIGFTFRFYGTNYTNVYVHANGFINFISCGGASCWTPTGIPSGAGTPNGFIAPMWMDLDPGGTGVRYKQDGTPPNRTLTVEYNNIAEYASPVRHTGKVVLYEVDSSIEFYWGSSTGAAGGWVAGIENQAGTVGVPAVGPGFTPTGGGPSAWPTNRGVRIALSNDPDLVVTRITPSSSVPPAGGMTDVEVEIMNLGAGAVAAARLDLFVNPPMSPPVVGTLSCPTCAFFATQIVAVPAGPGSRVTVVFPALSNPSPGAWELYAIIDNDQMVTEFNESNNVFGPSQIFWAGTLSMPFFDDFESGLNFTLEPLMPAGGGVVCGSCTGMPCVRARGSIRSGFQSHMAPMGNNALVLDSVHRGGAAEWPATHAMADVQDPNDHWYNEIPEHHGNASLTLDTTGYTQLFLAFDYNFVVNYDHQSMFTVEVDDGSGWEIPATTGMNGPLGNTYVPDECALCGSACPGCSGFYNDSGWLHESIDLSSYMMGPTFQVRFRFVARHNFDGSGCATYPNAVLIDNVRIDGVTMGLVATSPFPPASLAVAADDVDLDVLAFNLASVMQATTIESVTLSATGSGDDAVDIADLRLYEDADASLTLTPGDVLVGALGGGLAMDEGSATFLLPVPVALAAGVSTDYVVQLDLAGQASGNETFRIDLTDIGISSPVGDVAVGLPRAGSTLTVDRSTLTVDFGPNHPAMPRGVVSQTGVVVAQVALASSGSTTSVAAISLAATGSGDDSLGITEVRLVLEDPATTNGLVDPAETVLAAGTFPIDDGTVDLTLVPPVVVGVGAAEQVLVVMDFSAVATMPTLTDSYCVRLDAPGDVRSDAQTTTIAGGLLESCAEVSDSCPRTLCGDCNVDGNVNILDALRGAQHAAGVIAPLAGSAFSNCNVLGAVEPSPSASIDILDALVIAQLAAGLAPAHMCC